MTITKNAVLYDCVVLEESTYGTLPTSLGTEGVQLLEPPFPEPAFLTDGARPGPPGTLNQQRPARPTGRSVQRQLACEFKGTAATLAAGVTPEFHALLKACGLSATFSASPTPRWTYAPQNAYTGLTSVSWRAWLDGERYDARGGIGSFELVAENTGPARLNFDMQGILNDPVDEAVPVLAYPHVTVVPPTCTGMTISLGDFATAEVRSFRFAQGREIGPRANLAAASGHAGFAPGRRDPRLIITVAKTALVGAPYHTSAGLSPYDLVLPRDGTRPPTLALAIAMNGGLNNSFDLTLPTAVCRRATRQSDGPHALWELEFQATGAADFALVVR